MLETPDHIDESICLVINDLESRSTRVGVFSGVALFVGDMGRLDFYPAHSAGSMCGDGMTEGAFCTLGHEQRHDAALRQVASKAFISATLAEEHERSPYYMKMEKGSLVVDHTRQTAQTEKFSSFFCPTPTAPLFMYNAMHQSASNPLLVEDQSASCALVKGCARGNAGVWRDASTRDSSSLIVGRNQSAGRVSAAGVVNAGEFLICRSGGLPHCVGRRF